MPPGHPHQKIGIFLQHSYPLRAFQVFHIRFVTNQPSARSEDHLEVRVAIVATAFKFVVVARSFVLVDLPAPQDIGKDTVIVWSANPSPRKKRSQDYLQGPGRAK
jgi:hypothetical protein